MNAHLKTWLRVSLIVTIMVLSLGYLAWTGMQESKSYYKTISEIHDAQKQGDTIYATRLRVAGNVLPGSIKREGSRVAFTLDEKGEHLDVVYHGLEAPPDTFKDNAQALAEGRMGRDGIFQATQIQAKCASKYAPADQQQQPQATPKQS